MSESDITQAKQSEQRQIFALESTEYYTDHGKITPILLLISIIINSAILQDIIDRDDNWRYYRVLWTAVTIIYME